MNSIMFFSGSFLPILIIYLSYSFYISQEIHVIVFALIHGFLCSHLLLLAYSHFAMSY